MPLISYIASAGSGKTTTLVRQVLVLALNHPGPDYYRHILCTTFTNKAAAELKSRILETLHKIANHQSSPVIEAIVKDVGLPGEVLQQRAKAMLEHLLHHYGLLTVQTIDSFFQRLIRAFGWELGLPAGYEIVISDVKKRAILLRALTLVLKQTGLDPNITALMTERLNALLDQNQWKIKAALLNDSSHLINSNSLPVSYDYNPFEIKRRITELIQAFEYQMANLGQKGAKILHQNPEFIEAIKHGKNVKNYFEKIIAPKSIKDYHPLKAVLDCANTVLVSDWLKGKDDDKKRAMAFLIELSGLPTVIQNVCRLYDSDFGKYVSLQAIADACYKPIVSPLVEAALKHYKQQNRLVFLDDRPKFITEVSQEVSTLFLYERMGQRYYHYFIDEFQDTSNHDWQNFFPLLEESLAQSNTVVLVGDPKQAIYRFRGGDSGLIREATQSLQHFGLVNHTLNTNFRSGQAIIQFNNSLFYQILHYLQTLPLLENPAFSFLKTVYAPEAVAQFINPKAPIGYVSCEFVTPTADSIEITNQQEHDTPDDKPEKGTERTKLKKQIAKNQLPACINSLFEAGYRPQEVVILVRQKNDAVLMANALAEQPLIYNGRPCLIISENALTMTDSTQVLLVLALMRHLIDPSDKLALVEAAHHYRRLFVQAVPESYFTADYSTLAACFEPILAQHSTLLQLSAYMVAETILVNLQLLKQADAHLQALLDLILAFEQDGINTLTGFLTNFYALTAEEIPAIQPPENFDAIQIMTVHKSKGLEFEAVIIPFLDWDLEPGHRSTIAVYNRDGNPIPELPGTLAFEINPTEIVVNHSLFKDAIEKAYYDFLSDGLNLLYVALTRAKRAMYLFPVVPKIRTLDKPETVADLLYYALTRAENYPEPANQPHYISLKEHYLASEYRFLLGELTPPLQPQTTSNAVPITTFTGSNWRSKLMIRPKAEGLVESSTLQTAANFGEVIHTILAAVTTSEDLPVALQAAQTMGLLTHAETQTLIPSLTQLINDQQDWFNGKAIPLNEHEILTPQGELYRPDKLLLYPDGTVTVIDFKTGIPKPTHKTQVNHYATLLKQTGRFTNVQRVLVYFRPEIIVETW